MRKLASLFLVALVIVSLTGCVTAKLQEQWNTRTPDEQARIVMGGMQKQLGDLFDQGKLWVDTHPTYRPTWQTQVIPAFDAANTALGASARSMTSGTLKTEDLYRNVQPLIAKVVALLVQAGAIKNP